MTKGETQYRMWVFAAILKARKETSGRILASEVAELKIKYQYESFKQWAMAEGWLHGHGNFVYEGRKARGLEPQEIHTQLFND